MRIVLIVLGVLGAAAFLFPLTRGVFNIGTIAGTLISAVLILCGAFLPVISRGIGQLWARKPAGHAVTVMVLLIPAVLFFFMVLISVMMVKGYSRKPAEGATVVVLGCQVKGEKPTLALQERIEAAEAYLKEHPDAVCIVSGGKGSGERISEAECMFRELRDRGISENRIFLEDRSTTTRENLMYSEKIIKDRKLSPDLAIVTNEFHEYRAYLIAKGEGLESGAVPARTAPWLLPVFWVREWFGVFYEWFLVPKAY